MVDFGIYVSMFDLVGPTPVHRPPLILRRVDVNAKLVKNGWDY